jgi:hypothetical protein
MVATVWTAAKLYFLEEEIPSIGPATHQPSLE